MLLGQKPCPPRASSGLSTTGVEHQRFGQLCPGPRRGRPVADPHLGEEHTDCLWWELLKGFEWLLDFGVWGTLSQTCWSCREPRATSLLGHQEGARRGLNAARLSGSLPLSEKQGLGLCSGWQSSPWHTGALSATQIWRRAAGPEKTKAVGQPQMQWQLLKWPLCRATGGALTRCPGFP